MFNRPPPVGLARGFLGARIVGDLLDFVTSNQARFEQATIATSAKTSERRVSLAVRRALAVPEFGELQPRIEAKLESLIPAMSERLGKPPFATHHIETELVAHGDGAFFKRHVDTFMQQTGSKSNRVISGVYYFHALPKAFTGGALRLHSLAASGEPDTFIDIEPTLDTLVFFPSWFPHEVLPISCPSRRFLDSRFAINCWVYQKF
jgi:SM-20-related protein